MSNRRRSRIRTDAAGAEYEHTDIEPAVGYKFALWLGVAMLMSGAIVYGTFWFFEGRAVSIDDAARSSIRWPSARRKEPPAPRLQTQPFKDVYDLRRARSREAEQLRLGGQGQRRGAHPDRSRDGGHAANAGFRCAEGSDAGSTTS